MEVLAGIDPEKFQGYKERMSPISTLGGQFIQP